MAVQPEEWNVIASAAQSRVASWLAVLADDPANPNTARTLDREAHRADLLDGARLDEDGLAFTRRLLDAVVGVSDPFAAALSLRGAARELPNSMPMAQRLAVRAGGFASLGLPWAVLPVARRWLRDSVSHLVLSVKFPERDAADAATSAQAGVAANAALTGLLATRGSGDGRHGGDGRGGGDAGNAGTGTRKHFALIGTEVLGEAAVRRELDRLLILAAQPEVTSLAVDVARLAPSGLAASWSLDSDAERAAPLLAALLERACDNDTAVTLEASNYRGALLAPRLLIEALRQPGLDRAKVGVLLPAELPESLQTAQALARLSSMRVAGGGAPLELAVGVAGFDGREQIDSTLSGLPVPTIESREAQTAQLFRVLELVLRAGSAVRAVVASEDLHVLAAATVLAERIDHAAPLALQLRAGVAPRVASAIASHGFEVRSRLPIVPSKEFAGAVEYLIRMAAETADEDSELAHTRALFAGDAAQLDEGVERLRSSFDFLRDEAPPSRRVQQRGREWSEDARDTAVFYRAPTEPYRFDTGGLTAAVLSLTRAQTGAITLEFAGAPLRIPVISATGFANEPDSDGTRFENREWMRGLGIRARESSAGIAAVREAAGGSEDEAPRVGAVGRAYAAGAAWGELRPAERAKRVSRLALATAAARDRLSEVLLGESGAPVFVIDAQINGAVDAARYLGQLAGGLGTVRGAEFHPDRLALVVVDAGVPLNERAEAVLAAIAAGSAVVLVAHPSIARSSAVLLEEWQAAGLPEGVVSLAVAAASEHPRGAHLALAATLASDALVDRALVLGHRDTATELLRRHPALRVDGRFRAQGVTVVAPSADPIAAVRHILASAFGAAAADASTARAVVLLGTVARSGQLRRALADAVSSLRVGDATRAADPLALELGPLPELPSEAGLRALTQLEQGEKWLVPPERLDDEGLLWRPGVRLGVSRDSSFWQDAIGMPVIGIATAHSVDEAISLANRIGGGGAAALEANDPQETLPWLERVRAAALVVGRPTTGGRIERQPYGGWRAAGMGAAALAGGPHRLQGLGSWELREGTASQTLHLRGLSPEVQVLIETAQPSLDYQQFDRVRRAALSDALSWRTSLGRADDVSGLIVERNLLRHRPVATHVRLSEGAALGELVRVIAAGMVAGAPMSLSTGIVLPVPLGEFLARQGVPVALERDDDWLERLAVRGLEDDEVQATRIRLVGGDRARTAEWLGRLGEVPLWAEPVTMAGPVELLAFVLEQAVSISAHRHGLALLPSGVGGWIAELQGN